MLPYLFLFKEKSSIALHTRRAKIQLLHSRGNEYPDPEFVVYQFMHIFIHLLCMYW